jgi:hypothetical protein
MEQRLAGEYVTHETRALSHEKVDKQKRYSQIVECLIEGKELTAKECAVMMMQKGYIPTSERNYVSPRMTELGKKGIVEPIGKKICSYTGKKVAVWTLVGGRDVQW